MASEILDGYSANLIVAIATVAAALLLLFLVSRMLRNRSIRSRMRSGGGPRLAVLDSAAVDTTRRLVLVRRDDIEHLILIGGPSDLVIESRIEKKSTAPAATIAEPRLAQHQSTVAIAAPAPMQRQTPTTAVSAASPAKESAPSQPESRQLVDQPASKPVEGGRADQVQVENPAPSPAPNRNAAANSEAGKHIEEVLDNARSRVFGSASATLPAAGQAPHHQETPVPLNSKPKSSARFEDFLDAEIAGDLSAVTPGRASSTPPHVNADPVAEPKSSIDSDMARLLGELSSKR